MASASVCAVLLAAGARLATRLPTAALLATTFVLTLPLADKPPTRFLDGDAWAYPVPTLAALAAGLAAFAVSAIRTRGDAEQARWTTVGLAAASLGAFLSIPETGLLRLPPGPLCTVAIAGARFKGVRPLDPLSSVLVASCLAWLALAGGASRPSSVLGPACGLALASIVTVRAPPRAARWSTRFAPWALAAATVVVARVAGTVESTGLAAALTTASLTAAGLGIGARRSAAPGGSGPSEELQRPEGE